jgi:protein transport protein DSL1/ZW10
LAPSTLANHLATLRRDLSVHYIESILEQPTDATIASAGAEHRLTLYPAPPNADPNLRLENARIALRFLDEHLFSALPEPAAYTLPQSLTKALTGALLSKLLVPLLPTSQDALPTYLALVQKAVEFEADIVPAVLRGASGVVGEVRDWASGVGGHYERKRRADILGAARAVLLRQDNDAETFTVEVHIQSQRPASLETTSINDSKLLNVN